MASKHIETEIKIKVPDLVRIEQNIKQTGGKLVKPRIYERNVRYEDSANSLTPAGKVLRLRQDEHVRLTYKEPMQGMSRTELEIVISDYETADLLLQKLGFSPAWIYEKYRTTYELAACEVVLDEMPFGGFIEIEGAEGAIERAVNLLGVGNLPRILASYSDLFFHIKDRLHLQFRDLTFANFKDIELSALQDWSELGT